MQQTDYKEQYNNQLVRTIKIQMRCNKPITRNSTTTNKLEHVKIPMRCNKPITRNSTTTNQLEQ